MKLFLILLMFCSTLSFAATSDPMGLSDYVVNELHSDGNWYDRRMTNHEVDMFKAVGLILPDGSIKQASGSNSVAATQITKSPQAPVVPVVSPTPFLPKVHQSKRAIKNFHPSTHKIVSKPKPSSRQIAKKTKTKHSKHQQSKGTVQVRPAQFPSNPSRDEIHTMQQHIQSLERKIGKALDLSLSAYAVAEIPQATHGRTSIGGGTAQSKEGGALAIGGSKNFGSNYEYTVKVNLTHAGQTEAVGAGFGWEF